MPGVTEARVISPKIGLQVRCGGVHTAREKSIGMGGDITDNSFVLNLKTSLRNLSVELSVVHHLAIAAMI